jgi:hypothetical protein
MVRIPPYVPPPPNVTAGIPRLIGTFESVLIGPLNVGLNPIVLVALERLLNPSSAPTGPFPTSSTS